MVPPSSFGMHSSLNTLQVRANAWTCPEIAKSTSYSSMMSSKESLKWPAETSGLYWKEWVVVLWTGGGIGKAIVKPEAWSDRVGASIAWEAEGRRRGLESRGHASQCLCKVQEDSFVSSACTIHQWQNRDRTIQYAVLSIQHQLHTSHLICHLPHPRHRSVLIPGN